MLQSHTVLYGAVILLQLPEPSCYLSLGKVETKESSEGCAVGHDAEWPAIEIDIKVLGAPYGSHNTAALAGCESDFSGSAPSPFHSVPVTALPHSHIAGIHVEDKVPLGMG